jgi:hypothetical protein
MGYIAGAEFWAFDPSRGWMRAEDVPGKNVATGFGLGNKGYVYTGQDTNNFWQ